MSDVAVFRVAPPMRCCRSTDSSNLSFCGELAPWMRLSVGGHPTTYFCSRHREMADVPIAGDLLFRRVTIIIEVLFAAVTAIPGLAQIEALNRLDQAVERAGGVINLHGVTSTVGRWTNPAPSARNKGGRGHTV